MQDHRNYFPIEKMAVIFQVSTSGYYAYNKRIPSLREEENKKIMGVIQKIYKEGRSMYGSPRIQAKLCKLGIKCSRKRTARLMKENGIAAKMRKSWKRTTKQGKRKAYDNLVKQDFVVAAPNHTWVSDITYVKTKEGWLYVSATLDLFSRKVVGLSMGKHLETSLIINSAFCGHSVASK
jgi:putative transposase